MHSELVLLVLSRVATGGCDTLKISRELAVSSVCPAACFDILGTRTKGAQNSPPTSATGPSFTGGFPCTCM